MAAGGREYTLRDTVIPVQGDLAPGLSRFVERVTIDIRRRRMFGLQVFVSLGGRVIADAGIGWARPHMPMRPDAITHWLCCTKPLVACLIGRLEEAGSLDVDRPVADYIPAFGGAGKDEITVGQLLSHSSGLLGDPALEYMFCDWPEVVAAANRGEREVGWNHRLRCRYNDFTTWAILAEIIRGRVGVPVGRYLKETLFAELGLVDSHLGMSRAEWDRYGERLALLYVTARGGPAICAFLNWRAACEYDWAAFGARGPASDLGRIYEALLGYGPALIEPTTLGKLTRPAMPRSLDEGLGERLAWGLGFVSDGEFFGLDPELEGVFGHTGLGSSFSVAVPRWGLVVVCVGNVVSAPHQHRERMRVLMKSIVDGLRGEGAIQ